MVVSVFFHAHAPKPYYYEYPMYASLDYGCVVANYSIALQIIQKARGRVIVD